jgi:methylated-DNA-protein-cysteine methyltransferase related protein
MFQVILDTIQRIPKGKVATYGSVAEAAGFPGAARQVVWALRSGHGMICWHRVVGSGGRILLPGEAGWEQRIRLEQEGVKFRGNRIRLDLHEHIFAPPSRRKRAAAS